MNWNGKSGRDELRNGSGRRYASALLILLGAALLLSQTACSTPSATLVLDPRLTAPVDKPQLLGPTNRDVWIWAGEQQDVIEDCADRMDAIRGLTR